MKQYIVAAMLYVLAVPALAGTSVEEKNKLINVLGVNLSSGFGYVALWGLETTACPPLGVLRVELASASDRTLFATLLAAKSGGRAVSLTLEITASACIVRAVTVR